MHAGYQKECHQISVFWSTRLWSVASCVNKSLTMLYTMQDKHLLPAWSHAKDDFQIVSWYSVVGSGSVPPALSFIAPVDLQVSLFFMSTPKCPLFYKEHVSHSSCCWFLWQVLTLIICRVYTSRNWLAWATTLLHTYILNSRSILCACEDCTMICTCAKTLVLLWIYFEKISICLSWNSFLRYLYACRWTCTMTCRQVTAVSLIQRMRWKEQK